MCVCEREREKERESVCVCVCVCVTLYLSTYLFTVFFISMLYLDAFFFLSSCLYISSFLFLNFYQSMKIFFHISLIHFIYRSECKYLFLSFYLFLGFFPYFSFFLHIILCTNQPSFHFLSTESSSIFSFPIISHHLLPSYSQGVLRSWASFWTFCKRFPNICLQLCIININFTDWLLNFRCTFL